MKLSEKQNRLLGKQGKLSEKQVRLLGKQGEGSAKAHDDFPLPDWVLEPKHPVMVKFSGRHLHLSFDLQNRKILGEAFCEIQEVAKAYVYRVKQTLSDKSVEKTQWIS